MPSASFQSLGLYDLLGNIIPGSTLLLLLFIMYDVDITTLQISGSVLVFIYLLLAIVSGHIVQAFTSWVEPNPTLFGEIIEISKEEAEGSDVDYNDIDITVTQIERSIWPLLQRRFQLDDEFNDFGTLFRLLMSENEAASATRSMRFQALHSFHRNMYGVFVITLLVSFLGLALGAIFPNVTRSIYVPLLMIPISTIGMIIFYKRKDKFNKRFIQYAIIDFYRETTEN